MGCGHEFRASCSGFQVSDIDFPTSAIEFLSNFGFRVWGIEVRISGFRDRSISASAFSSCFRIWVFGLGVECWGYEFGNWGLEYRVSGTVRFRVSGFEVGLRVSCFVFRVWDFGFRVSGFGCALELIKSQARYNCIEVARVYCRFCCKCTRDKIEALATMRSIFTFLSTAWLSRPRGSRSQESILHRRGSKNRIEFRSNRVLIE